MNNLLRPKEAAAILGLKPASLRELDRKGLLHPVRDWAGHRRFREDELKSFRDKLLDGTLGRHMALPPASEQVHGQ